MAAYPTANLQPARQLSPFERDRSSRTDHDWRNFSVGQLARARLGPYLAADPACHRSNKTARAQRTPGWANSAISGRISTGRCFHDATAGRSKQRGEKWLV